MRNVMEAGMDEWPSAIIVDTSRADGLGEPREGTRRARSLGQAQRSGVAGSTRASPAAGTKVLGAQGLLL